MRRDLAVCRAAQSTKISNQNGDEVPTNGAETEQNIKSDTVVVRSDTDVTMTEDSPIEILGSPPHSPHETIDTKAALPADDNSTIQTNEPEKQNDTKPRSPLQLDIPSEAHVETEQSGDNAATGTYSNFDFESLFNDPNSAAPGSNASPNELAEEPASAAAVTEPPSTTAAPEAPIESESKLTATAPSAAATATMTAGASNDNDNNNQFDFTDLTDFGDDTNMADTDNISSLLPGLESYANAQDSSEQQQQQQTNDTFNIFDAAGGPDFGAVVTTADIGNSMTQTADQSGQQQQQRQNDNDDGRDTTFDDIMDFNNFDLGEFGGDGTEMETKFDADFFNI